MKHSHLDKIFYSWFEEENIVDVIVPLLKLHKVIINILEEKTFRKI